MDKTAANWAAWEKAAERADSAYARWLHCADINPHSQETYTARWKYEVARILFNRAAERVA